jgi:S1-C subfamily serine protease
MRDIIKVCKKRLSLAILVVFLSFGSGYYATTLPAKLELTRLQQTKETVVEIRTKKARGSGVIVSEGGLIITNRHVIGDNKQVEVIHKTISYMGEVIWLHPKTDLAAIWIVAKKPFPYARLADYSDYTHGDRVNAIGNPLGISLFVSEGIISKFSRLKDGTTVIWHDSVILEGSSGGGLFDMKGRLIGINTWRIKQQKHDTGIGVAISGKDYNYVIEKLKLIYG